MEIIHASVGPVGKWGRPRSYEKKSRSAITLRPRARILTTPTSSTETVVSVGRAGARIVFDDYPIRPNYHELESELPRVLFQGFSACSGR